MREKSRRHGGARAVWAVMLLLVCGGSVRAQQTNSARNSAEAKQGAARTNTFALERENSERVAASPEQIREVLVKNPGLLVELKQLTPGPVSPRK